MKHILVLVMLTLVSAQEYVAAQAEFNNPALIAGRDYLELPQSQQLNQPLEQVSIDFYFYPESLASYQVDIALSALSEQYPSLIINKIPYIHNYRWRKYAKMFYIAQSLAIEQQLLTELYSAIHELKLSFDNAQDFIDQLPALKPHQESVLEGFSSSTINERINQQQKMLQELPVKGVPSIILNKRWLIDASMAQSTNHLMSILRRLVQDSL